jgi:hypothetical protein
LRRDEPDELAPLLAHARAACRHGVAVELAGESVSFWSDLRCGADIAHTIFGPYCAVRDVSRADGGWRVASAEVPELPVVTETLVAGAGPPVAVRRWGGDFPADRYDLGSGRCVVVHRQPFVGLTVFLRDERELYYLRPGAAFEIPHTEHVVKYPLRVGLRLAGFSQVHAAACSFRGRGLLLVGQRRSGKSTLLMRLLSRGARFVASDLSFVRRAEGEKGSMIAFPHMLRIAAGTIGDNERLRESLARHPRTGDYLRSPVFNTGKEEFYFPVLARVWGDDVICRAAPLDVVVFPALDLNRTRTEIARLSRDETERRIRETLVDDLPILDWLPFMSDAEFESLRRASAEEVVRCAPAGYEVRFGSERTDPAGAVEEMLEAEGR